MVVGFTIQIIKILDLIQWIDEKMLSPQICVKNDKFILITTNFV
jgi:hypothetical protein